MSNVIKPSSWWANQQPPDPPEPPNMEQRVAKLEALAEKTGERLNAIENRLTSIETKLDGFNNLFATKADLHKAINDQTWKIIGAMITLGSVLSGIVFFIARNVR